MKNKWIVKCELDSGYEFDMDISAENVIGHGRLIVINNSITIELTPVKILAVNKIRECESNSIINFDYNGIYFVKNRGVIFFVKNICNCNNFDWIIGKKVSINNFYVGVCKSVESYSKNDHYVGELIGVIVGPPEDNEEKIQKKE